MLRIAVAGNCQLVPLVKFLKTILSDDVDIVYLPIYTCSNDEVQTFHEYLTSADILINTLTTESYRNDIGLGSKYLTRLLPHKSLKITVPCVYYTGYFPTSSSLGQDDALVYNYSKQLFYKSKYHDYIPIVLAQNNIHNISYEDLDRVLTNNNEAKNLIYQYHLNSITELQKREQACDIIISDEVINLYQEVCFITYNHPNQYLLTRFYNKIINQINNFYNIHISLCNSNNCAGLNESDKMFIYKFILKALDITKYSMTTQTTNNSILQTLIKYYADQEHIMQQKLNSAAYHNSKKLLQYGGFI